MDASTTLAALLHGDPNHQAALDLFEELGKQGVLLCAPAMFDYECHAVIRLNVYRGTLTTAQAATALVLLQSPGVMVEYDPANSQRAYEIATEYDQPRSYDAAYAAHAEARAWNC